MSGKRLPKEVRAEIYRRLMDGEKQTELARIYGVTDSTITYLCRRYEESNRRPPQVWMTDEQIEHMYRAADYTKAQIERLAQLNGVTPRVIRRILSERGVLRE